MPGESRSNASEKPQYDKAAKRKYKRKQQLKQLRQSEKEAKLNLVTSSLQSLTTATSDPQSVKQLILEGQFESAPLSAPTAKGLKTSNYVVMTDIQKHSLPFTLSGKDVLGAAKTGSGKTLAFLVPVLEALWKANWTPLDGLGALIISPTRELALQIFTVLRQVGKFHSFSAGLLIGGKDLKAEQERVSRMNILVATPGRLLQHMDQTPEFNYDNLQILVLDEADRILDFGFEKTLNAILEHLPKSRQTLLFSATQTKSVKDLARLSLQNPEYIAVHEKMDTATPTNLIEKYMVVPLPQKLDVLYSFLKSHLKQKVIVFMSSCKQVRFVFEAFCRLQPGIPLMCLHGKQKQPKRMAIFEQFCRKQSACLFATDIAARGLDFPAVDWVIQLDCPEDVATYIHRVGRTARYESSGSALLFLLPSESSTFLSHLAVKKIPISETKLNPSKLLTVQGQFASFCSQSPEIKYLAQKAFICYMRSIYLQKDKCVFDVHALPADDFAQALGLPGTPKIKFVKKGGEKNASRQISAVAGSTSTADKDEGESDSDEQDTQTKTKQKTKIDKMFEKKNMNVLSEHYTKLVADDSSASESDEEVGDEAPPAKTIQPVDDDDDLLTLTRKDHDIDESQLPFHRLPSDLSHRDILKLRKKELKARGRGDRLIFDEEGNPVLAYKLESLEEFEGEKSVLERKDEYLTEAAQKMKEVDVKDKDVEKRKKQEVKLMKKLKKRAAERGEDPATVTLEPYHDDEDHDSEEEMYSESGEPDYNSESDMDRNQEYQTDDESDESGSDAEPQHHSRKRKADDQTPSQSKQLKLDSMDQGSLEDLALKLLGN